MFGSIYSIRIFDFPCKGLSVRIYGIKTINSSFEEIREMFFSGELIHLQGKQLPVCQNCFASPLKRIYSKRQEFALSRVDPFQKGWVCRLAKQEVAKVVSLIKWWTIY